MQPYTFDGTSTKQIIKGPIYWAVVLSAKATGSLIFPSWSFNDGVQFPLGTTGPWARISPPGKPWNEISVFGAVTLLACHDPCEQFPQYQPQSLSGNFSRTEWGQLIRAGMAFYCRRDLPAGGVGSQQFLFLHNITTGPNAVKVLVKEVLVTCSAINTMLVGLIADPGPPNTSVQGFNLLLDLPQGRSQAVTKNFLQIPSLGPLLFGNNCLFLGSQTNSTSEVTFPRTGGPDFIAELNPGVGGNPGTSCLLVVPEPDNTDLTVVFKWAEIPIGIAQGTYP